MVGKVAALLLLAIFLIWSGRWLRRLMFLQDYAYAVTERFGPTLSIPVQSRIRRKIPWARHDMIDAWLADFALVNDEVWRLARLGGTHVIGHRNVTLRLRTKFPFLRFEGLRQATFLVSYYAWHEGYDSSPETDARGELS
jgi:hypothetical protein